MVPEVSSYIQRDPFDLIPNSQLFRDESWYRGPSFPEPLYHLRGSDFSVIYEAVLLYGNVRVD